MDMCRLTIVIPALNEEGAIGATIERCLAAREGIVRVGGVTDVELIVVSDGSTDRTAEIARQYDEVQVIEFEENQGYGAAIKTGWEAGCGELLAFLDADGTCDPRFFEEMTYVAITQNADVVLGSRLGPESKMPRVRRFGNRIYALGLGFLCGRHVTDTASGMRVVRRSALTDLYPLPDGLHFTPSMSARALLNNLRVLELPMRYEERIGESKLSVLRDGVLFFKTIFEGVLCYRPEKMFLIGFSIAMLLLLLLAANPAEFYLRSGRLEDWMIYRFAVCSLLGSFGLMLLLATGLVNRAARLSRRRVDANPFWPALISSVLRGPALLTLLVGSFAASIGFLWPGIVDLSTTGKVYLHWSRLLAGAFFLFSALQMSVFAVLMRVVGIWVGERGIQGRPFPRSVSMPEVGISGSPQADDAATAKSGLPR
jgi:glycosyltransferase involved in cell wall biosynthesis